MATTPVRHLTGSLVMVLALAAPANAARDDRLVEAIKARNAAAVARLLEQHVDVNAPEPGGAAPLHWAAHRDVVWPDDEDLFVGSSGALLFITEHMVWPRAIEVDGAHRTNLRINAIDTKARSTDDNAARVRARKPIGQWQAVEIVSRNGEIRSSLNGVPVSIVHEHEFTQPGHIGFQAQGVPIQWRNIRIKAG